MVKITLKQNNMKLKVENSVKDLKALELGEVCLFYDNNKSMYLNIIENEIPHLIIKLNKEKHIFSLSEKDKAQELFDNAFIITDDIYNDGKKLKSFIMNCEVGVKYKYSDGKRAIEIDTESDGTFHWTFSSGWNNIYPMQNANYIKTFKTDKGARLSLIKHLGI